MVNVFVGANGSGKTNLLEAVGVLSAAVDEFGPIDDQALLSSKGDTQIHRVEVSEEVLNATQEGLSLSNLWFLGRLGGVPDIF